jgi:hypothetical protein
MRKCKGEPGPTQWDARPRKKVWKNWPVARADGNVPDEGAMPPSRTCNQSVSGKGPTMNRQRKASAPVHYTRPTLESLEDRTLLDATPVGAAFVGLMHNFAHSAAHNTAAAFVGQSPSVSAFQAANFDLLKNPGNVSDVVTLAQVAANAQVIANTAASNAAAFMTFFQAGLLTGA